MLNKDILGQALYDVRNSYSNKTLQNLIDTYGSLEGARLSQAKDEADAIINHFKTNAKLTVPGTGLASPSGAVTGSSITGTIS